MTDTHQLTPTSKTHPLDPITAGEMSSAIALLRKDDRLSPLVRFWGATLDENHARAVLAETEQPGIRKLQIVAIDSGNRAAWEVDVWLGGAHERLEWKEIDFRRPGITSEEARAAAHACRESPEFQAVMAKRGVTDMSSLVIDAESMGGFVPEKYADRRVTWGTVWYRTSIEDNAYARPVQGVVPIIDMTTMEILEVEDHGVVPISDEAGGIEPGDWGDDRPGLKALDIVQPEGPSFDVDGHAVTWQGWSFRVGFTHREGLVLYDLAFKGRSVLKRAACNEMYVPYLDSNATQYRKNFFDWGEYGAGPLTNSLEQGCDCLGVIRYLDGIVLGGDGSPRTIPQAICMHEEDDSVLWKHMDLRRDVGQVRRSRRLVISNFQTVANYDYGFYWSLYQDGRIELEVKLTGMLSASGFEDGDEVRYGRVVSKNVQTPTHQHYFGIRLDAAVDGEKNRLVEEHAEGETDESLDPYGNAVRNVRVPLLSESVAAQRVDPSIARRWRIESADAVNRYGEPTAYRLSLPNTVRSYSRPGSVMARRAPFIHQHLWATQADPSENFIGGQYPNNAEPGEDGVHVWQEQNRSLDGEEIVLWAVIGTHHFPRPEQWPVMPVDHVGLSLEPDGFFDRNPAMDIAAPAHGAHGAHGADRCAHDASSHAGHDHAGHDNVGHDHAGQDHSSHDHAAGGHDGGH
ncbi:primary-amine oxidase [Subtercola endophyticus]|uniref:primary-amine oxidase n=1 Tax=Subtercola endophyticus TaxID=2895559 RepID=UPI001E47EB2A|nr:primary-amine oxidase [Subtercola endophyticus]UFS58669.1 primary-amine oxidase [Subtercola endophyticus]